MPSLNTVQDSKSDYEEIVFPDAKFPTVWIRPMDVLSTNVLPAHIRSSACGLFLHSTPANIKDLPHHFNGSRSSWTASNLLSNFTNCSRKMRAAGHADVRPDTHFLVLSSVPCLRRVRFAVKRVISQQRGTTTGLGSDQSSHQGWTTAGASRRFCIVHQYLGWV